MNHYNKLKSINIYNEVIKLPLAKQLLQKSINYETELQSFNTSTNVIEVNEKFLKKYGAIICMIAVAVAPMASEFCRVKYYQPKEPEGLDKLLLKVQKNYE